MTTILSQNHTSHFMLSTHHHNIKNTSTKHHKHTHIIVSTSTRHYIILKGSKDSTLHIKEFIIQDKYNFFFQKNSLFQKSTSYKKFIIQIHPFLKKFISSFSFEISLGFLKFLIFFFSTILSLEF